MVQPQSLERNKSPQNNTNIQEEGIGYQTILLNSHFKLSVNSDKLCLHRCQFDSNKNIEEYICFKKIENSIFHDKKKLNYVPQENENEELEKKQSLEVYKILDRMELVGYRLTEKNTKEEWYYVLEGYTEKKG